MVAGPRGVQVVAQAVGANQVVPFSVTLNAER